MITNSLVGAAMSLPDMKAGDTNGIERPTIHSAICDGLRH